MLSINNLVKTRLDGKQPRTILNNLKFEIGKGESVSVMGDSGCGKSTLLNIIAGLESYDQGEIFHDDRAIHNLNSSELTAWRKQHLGVVFQQFNLIDCLSVIDNIKFPARLNKNLDEDWIEEISDRLQIRSLWKKPIQDISGGEQQRIAVARAVAHKPSLVLADEPTGNLDNQNALQVADLLNKICKTNDTPLILVTHSLSIAQKTDRRKQLNKGQLHAVG